MTLDESDQEGGPRATWLLTERDGWWRSYLPCGPAALAVEAAPAGGAALVCEDTAWQWNGAGIVELNRDTLEPVSWPEVGW